MILLKPEDLKQAFHQLTPDAAQKERMKTILENNLSGGAQPCSKIGVIVTACAAALIMTCSTIAFTSLMSGRRALPAIIASSSVISPTTGISTAETSSVYSSTAGTTSSLTNTSTAVSASATKSATSTAVTTATSPAAIVYHLMQYDDRQYQHLVRNDGVKTDYQGKPLYAQEKDIGEQLGIVSFGWGKGSPVYRYKPIGNYMIVAVKIGDQFELYTFREFAELNGTRLTYGPDARAYLELYNVRSAADICKIDVYQIDHYTDKESENGDGLDCIGSTEEAEMIERFYQLFAALRSDGNAYEIAVSNAPTRPYSMTSPPPAAVVQNNETQSTRIKPAQPPQYILTAFENAQTVRLTLFNGQEMEFTYYPNIRFLCQYTSRYALDDTMVDLIASLNS